MDNERLDPFMNPFRERILRLDGGALTNQPYLSAYGARPERGLRFYLRHRPTFCKSFRLL